MTGSSADASDLATPAPQPARSMFTLQLTDGQQDLYRMLVGARKSPVTLSHRTLGMLALTAAAAQRDILPITSSPETLHRILHPDSLLPGETPPYVICLQFTDEQAQEIRRITGRDMRYFALVPDEYQIEYAEDWEARAPSKVGSSIIVATEGETVHERNRGRTVIMPAASGKGVFGTGFHPATRIALAMLEESLEPSARVFDIGTGSGILALVALRLGAGSVLAVDIDPEAVIVARRAAELNGLQARMRVEKGSTEVANEQFDLVLMNVFPKVILALAPDLPRIVRPGGLVITSGVVDARKKQVAKALARHGFSAEGEHSRGNWTAQRFRRTS